MKMLEGSKLLNNNQRGEHFKVSRWKLWRGNIMGQLKGIAWKRLQLHIKN